MTQSLEHRVFTLDTESHDASVGGLSDMQQEVFLLFRSTSGPPQYTGKKKCSKGEVIHVMHDE